MQIILCLTARTHSRTRQQDEGGSNPGDNCELESKLELELDLELLLLALCMAPEGAKNNTHNSAWPNSIK